MMRRSSPLLWSGGRHGGYGVASLKVLFVMWLFLVSALGPYRLVYAKQFFDDANDKEILDFLLHKNTYDKRIKPHSDGPLRVNVSVLLLSLSSPDESSLKYEVEFLLRLFWVDSRLEHDDKMRYPYLSGMHHLEDIWLPDLLFIKVGDFKEPLQPDHIALKIYRNGTVDYMRRRHLILSCSGNLNIFPFDDPSCTFALESMTHEKDEIEFSWCASPDNNNGTTLVKTEEMRSLNAYIIANATLTCRDSFLWRGNYSCLRVNLNFTRDDAFYFSTVFGPGIILVTSSFITFWLEWNAVPARVMIGVTTMLNFFTTSNSFRSTLPVVSNLSAMNLWDSVCMFFIYVSLLEFVAVNYVGRKRPKHNMAYMPGENAVIQRIPQAIHRIGLSLCGDNKKKFPAQAVRHRGVGGAGVPVSSGGPAGGDARNSHELMSTSFANCDTDQSHRVAGQDNCANGEDNQDTDQRGVSQVEYTFQSPHKGHPTHPIRIAKSIDVVSRVVFPLSYGIFIIYFFTQYSVA